VGAWPIEKDRLVEYMLKAAREAKTHTDWVYPNAGYEDAVTEFIAAILQDRLFVADLEAFIKPLIRPARLASLSQTLIKYTAPGVPDLYQGSELWDHSLVDPDNRRPVDYEQRRQLLGNVEATQKPEQVLRCMDSGLPKLFVIHRALQLRRRRAECFGAAGEYQPLHVQGTKAEHAVAYMRGGEVITIVPRLLIRREGDWADTYLALPEGQWRDVFTQRIASNQVRLSESLRDFPVMLLERQGGQQ
jgi:(1->4)-alpha-D-glucan 1-alpha-D-glucosylmutase